MRSLIVMCITVVMLGLTALDAAGQRTVQVRGYVRKDGTYVQPHYRTAPNATMLDNWSTVGNVNPYTGKPGWIVPDYTYIGGVLAGTYPRNPTRQQIESALAPLSPYSPLYPVRRKYVQIETTSSDRVWGTAAEIYATGFVLEPYDNVLVSVPLSEVKSVQVARRRSLWVAGALAGAAGGGWGGVEYARQLRVCNPDSWEHDVNGCTGSTALGAVLGGAVGALAGAILGDFVSWIEWQPVMIR